MRMRPKPMSMRPLFSASTCCRGGHLQQAQLQLRVAAQVADQLRQHAIQRRGHEADAEPLALALADPPGAVADALQLVQERRALFVEEAPGFGQAQRPAALQQGHPEHFLELLDLPAQRWLGDVQCSAARVKLRVRASAWK